MSSSLRWFLLALAAVSFSVSAADRTGYYGVGKPASAEEIAGWDIDIRPDGKGLPPGEGSVEDGEMMYEEKCAECHGSFGEGVGRFPVLAGGEGTLRDARPSKTVGSYWPYVSTLWDYIHRTMPFTAPESLTDNEVYAISAYVLYLNDLVDDEFVLSQDNLASIKLPNQPNFYRDDRPDTQNTRCMKDCKDPASIQVVSSVGLQVTEEAAEEAVAEIANNPVYEQYCAICHKVGVAGAPILGDTEAWAQRNKQGMAVLVEHAIKGYTGSEGVMPAKGGFMHLSDDDVAEAVKYMVEKSR